MADWLSTVKDVMINLVCGDVWKDTPKSSNPVSLQGCELEVLSSELPAPVSTMVSLDDSSDDSISSSEVDEGTPLTRSENTGQHKETLGNTLSTPSQTQVQCQCLQDIPIRTKAAQGVILEGGLYVGGGYVTNSKQGAIIYKFDPIFEMWDPLPPCPLKLFGMTSYGDQLVIVGGKEVGLGSSSSNKVFGLDKEDGCWKSTMTPPMMFARVSPVVVSYDQFLIVAGGTKGSLDYNVEIYSRTSNRWTTAPSLPTKCFPTTSTVCDHTWYLLDPSDSVIKSADIRSVIQLATGELSSDGENERDTSQSSVEKTFVWSSLPKPPCKPKQISTIGGKLIAICCEECKVSCYVYDKDTPSWSASSKLPTMCGHASAIADDNGLFLFGGEGGLDQYSNKLYRLTLKTSDDTLSHKAKKTKPPITFRFH